MAQIDRTVRLQTKNITVRFGATAALSGVNFSAAQGEIHALLGENGAGKSTLMKVLAGAVLPESGEILLDGECYAPQNPLQARLAGITTIFQELSVVPHLTVEENISLGLESGKGIFLDRRAMRKRAQEALTKLGHEDIRLDALAGGLTISAQQIVEIARSIALGCRVLILDEPTSSLDRHDVDCLFRLLRGLKQQGYTIIYISHFLEEAKEIADVYTILRDGTVVACGTMDSVTPDQLIGEMIGTNLEHMYRHTQRHPGETVLEIKDLSGLKGLKSASLSLRAGEVLGIAGLVGSGRSSLVRAIFGLAPVRSGNIKVFSYSGWAQPHDRWQQGVGFLSEDRKNEGIALSMTVADNLVLTKTQDSEVSGLLLPEEKDQLARRWIEELSIKCTGPRAKMFSLSGGNQQKVAFARLLHHCSDLLILDEPTRGVDVQTKSLIYSLIDQLTEQGKAVLIVSNYLPELFGVCDRIAVMRRGNLSESRKTSEWLQSDLTLEIVSVDQTGAPR